MRFKAKYKIVTNGEHFRVMHKEWFWPFWMYVRKDYYEFSIIRVFETREEAQEFIDDLIAAEQRLARPWVDA